VIEHTTQIIPTCQNVNTWTDVSFTIDLNNRSITIAGYMWRSIALEKEKTSVKGWSIG
jgi:hypothetical protein